MAAGNECYTPSAMLAMGRLAVLSLLLVSCLEKRPPPCLPWVKPGESYDVSLGARHLLPSSLTGIQPRSCGDSFDLRVGDIVTFQTMVSKYVEPSCDRIDASVTSSVRNVMLDQPGVVPGGAFNPELQATYTRVTVGTDCRGGYRIGLTRNPELHLYRTFQPNIVDDCLVPGSELSEEAPSCWDSWLVQVRDSTGTIVADSTVAVD